ncbi:MAG: hypothetical protein Q4A39_06095, partial [Eubacteriales bacterium]|nr:hypothetical protein [Eubacteriales bacterium]
MRKKLTYALAGLLCLLLLGCCSGALAEGAISGTGWYISDNTLYITGSLAAPPTGAAEYTSTEIKEGGKITGGTWENLVTNYGTIEGGTFNGSTFVNNHGTISGGTFEPDSYSDRSTTVINNKNGIISGGTFSGSTFV